MRVLVYYRSLFDRFLPAPRCLLCAARGDHGLPLCEGCHADLPWLVHACPSCAEPLPRSAPAGSACGRCLRQPPALGRTLCALRYEFPVNHLTHRYKDHAELPVLRLMARLFSDRFGELIAEQPPDLLLPVPLHPARLRARGYNQAAELAYWIGRQLALPVRDDLLQRRLPTPHQQGLSAKQRRQNLRHAFSAELPQGIRRVALIDDVITTGATCQVVAQTLRRAAGARRGLSIEAWSVARTPPTPR